MIVLGIDPSAEAPGYAVWDTDAGRHVYWGVDPWKLGHADVAVVERGGWRGGRMGSLACWGLGFDAAWRLKEVDATQKYVVTCKAWREALEIPNRLSKTVIVNRLRRRYQDQESTDDVVEARGVAEATAIILARPLKKNRAGLKEIRR